MDEAPNLLGRKDRVVQSKSVIWWDTRGLHHPLTDDEFKTAFCNHVFETTPDISVKAIRNRVYFFVRNFMAPDLRKNLDEYRKIYR